MSLLSALEGVMAELARNERENGPPPVRIECSSRLFVELRDKATVAATPEEASGVFPAPLLMGIPVVIRWDMGPHEYAVVFEAMAR